MEYGNSYSHSPILILDGNHRFPVNIEHELVIKIYVLAIKNDYTFEQMINQILKNSLDEDGET